MKLFKGVVAIVAVGAIAWVSYGLFAGPKEAGTEPAAGEQGAPGQPMPVKVSTVTPKEVQLWHSFSGKLVAIDTVDIRPRVGGAIEKIYFQPGEIVEKGAPLFLIDPRPYQAEVNRAAAALAVARNQAVLAKSEAERSQRLIKENALSQREFDERQNNNRVAQANIQAASAALEQAKLNLIYATITSPIKGKISRAEITQGNLVDPNAAPVLATVVSTDEIYADFDIDETTYLKNVRKDIGTDDDAKIPVQLVLNSDQSVYEGTILAFDNKLDASAGTIRARAIFANKDHALVPGMFADVRLGNPEKTEALLVPERIVNTDQDKKFVYVVDDKNVVTYRPIKLGASVDGMRVVLEGLQAGERVVVKGLQRLRPGTPVQPEEVPLTNIAEEMAEKQQALTAAEQKPDEATAATPTESSLTPVEKAAPEETAQETSAGNAQADEPAAPVQQEAVPAPEEQAPAADAEKSADETPAAMPAPVAE